MSSVSRYVHSQNLRSITINSSLGEVEVYLDQAKAAGDVVTVDISGTMGEIEIYVPTSWRVNSDNLDLALGELDIDDGSTGGGPTLMLTGHFSMGDVEVNYV
ncbi:LiaF-related protein [Lactobacillus sp. R2/2]|nr:LiaF-related protein [Lactobacillus sp. R2/2]